jgi:hypothetical protein
MSEYNSDEIQYAIDRTGANVKKEDVINVLRFLSGPTHDQNDSIVVEGEEYTSDRLAMGGGFPTAMASNPTRRGNEKQEELRRDQMDDDETTATDVRDKQTGTLTSKKGT